MGLAHLPMVEKGFNVEIYPNRIRRLWVSRTHTVEYFEWLAAQPDAWSNPPTHGASSSNRGRRLHKVPSIPDLPNSVGHNWCLFHSVLVLEPWPNGV